MRWLTDITELLEEARTGTTDAALLEALVGAYRRRPLPALAELITIAGKRAAVAHELKGSLDEQHATWLRVAVQLRAIDVDWLLETLLTNRGEYSIERIMRLESWPVDPRISNGLLRLAGHKQMTSRGARNTWRIAFRIISKRIHPGLATTLQPMLALEPQTEFERVLLRRLRVIEVKLQQLETPSSSTTENAVLMKLSERVGVAQHRAAEKTADDLFREVWATPLDDGPRVVFADWLQERDDARGEFIALQLARRPDDLKARARERALLSKHHREWAAPFDAVLSYPQSLFERGFLALAAVHWRKLASLPALMTHPAWATVRAFKIDPEGERVCDAWIDHLLALGAKRV